MKTTGDIHADEYKSIVENISEAIIAIDEQGCVTLMNPLAERLTGWTEGEARGKPGTGIFRIVNERFQGHYENPMEPAVPGILARRSKLLARDGTEHPIIDSAFPIRDTEGNVTGRVLVFRDVTEADGTQEALKESEKKYRTLIEITDTAYVIVDDQGKLLDANQKYVSLTGHNHLDEIRNHSVLEWTADHARARNLEAVRQCIAKGFIRNLEIEYTHKDGANVPVEINATVVKTDFGTNILTLCRDITERKRAEEALAKSEAKVHSEQRFSQLLLDTSAAFIVAIDFSGKTLMMNHALLAALEYAAEEIRGADYLTTFVPEEDREILGAVFQQIVKEGKATVNENRIRSRSGMTYLVEWHGRTVIHGGGDPDFFVGVGIDITDRKHAERALRESEEKYRVLFDSGSDAILVQQPVGTLEPGTFLEANEAACRMLGYDREELLTLSPVVITKGYPDGTSPATEAMQLLQKHGSASVDRVFITKDGQEVPVELNMRLFQYQGRSTVLTVARNITDRKRAEEEKQKLQDQLAQARKMESVGRLAGGVAHDFNNMLSVILGNVEMALFHADCPQPLRGGLEEIRKAAERSAELTRQLLAFARKQTVTPRVLNLNDTVDGMLKMLWRLIGEDIDLAWMPGHDLWRVKIDPAQIDQILVNLLVNARDAIAGVGKVTIETKNTTCDETYCALHADSLPGEYVMLAVSDTGHGMDQEILAHIFEPFFTTKEPGKGTGLGMATVYGIVKQNNGFIDVCSEPGKGTSFYVFLPRYTGRSAGVSIEESSEAGRGGLETVLLVEDEPSILKLCHTMLGKLGYVVLAAATPGEAIHLAEEHSGEIHLLMTDVVMPEMNGRDLAKRLLSLYPNLKRLFMSGYTADVIAHQGIVDEGVDFIQKPFSMKDMAAKVRGVLDRG